MTLSNDVRSIYQIKKVSPDLALCPNLKTLRLQDNALKLANFPISILTDSKVSLLSIEGNQFDMKELSETEGYEKVCFNVSLSSFVCCLTLKLSVREINFECHLSLQYMERYTATKKKLM